MFYCVHLFLLQSLRFYGYTKKLTTITFWKQHWFVMVLVWNFPFYMPFTIILYHVIRKYFEVFLPLDSFIKRFEGTLMQIADENVSRFSDLHGCTFNFAEICISRLGHFCVFVLHLCFYSCWIKQLNFCYFLDYSIHRLGIQQQIQSEELNWTKCFLRSWR